MGMTIGKLIVQRDNFKVDETYQRPPDAWSNKDKQCFIDTILRLSLIHISEPTRPY